MRYPTVLSEFETLQLACQGRSLARYGDGEFSMAAGGHMKNQRHHPALSRRLREILLDADECLVGIPNIHPSVPTPKRTSWDKYLDRGAKLLSPTVQYVSAFVTRPDSAPWIDRPEYWALLETLWIGQDVVLVRGSGKGLLPEDLIGATSVREVLGPPQHAWVEYDRLMSEVGTPSRVLLCLGATATVMAVDLCAKGAHAVDLGHIALFLRKHRRGESMTLTKDEKQPPGWPLPTDWNPFAVPHA